jgi:hypothetical protein
MARLRMRVCAEPGCPEIQLDTRCPDHTRQTDRARGTRQQRGYGREHEQLRARWAPAVARGEVDCHADPCIAPILRILPGEEWHLDHTADRTGYRGPAHARCNTSAGGRAAHGG